MKLSRQNLIWNRATLESDGLARCAGDTALAGLLLAHGLIMNGGVEHALECMSQSQLLAALGGYRYFGLERAAHALEMAAQTSGADSNDLDEPYWRAVPDDAAIVAAFTAKLLSNPAAFAPLAEGSHA